MGLTPEQVLDMNLFEYLCCVRGHHTRTKQEQVLAVITGYYSGYYTMNKKAKRPAKIIKQIMSPGTKRQGTRSELTHDAITEFAEREKRFAEFFGSSQSKD